MTHTDMPKNTNQRRDPVQFATKIGLIVVFVLGAVLVFMGYRAQVEFNRSGFSSETAYQVINTLSSDVSNAWSQKLQPDLNKMSETDRTALDGIVAVLLKDAWNTQKKGSGEEVMALAESSAEAADYKLLYTAYLVNGPKVNASQRKTITAMKESEATEFRQWLLECILDEEKPLPAEAEPLAGSLTGSERQAMLMQIFFVSSGSAESKIMENVNNFKKTVRSKESQLTAFRMIALGEVPWLWQLIISNSRTAILIGIILMIDVVLLAFLMNAEKLWVLDFKWIMILVIVDFLLFFQLLPMIFIVVRAVFPDGVFSFEVLKRLFTYPLNLVALRNTFTAAFATMILGTAIAFPLAWLVGRTNLYGKKFFFRCDVYGAALCRRDGMAAADESKRWLDQPVAAGAAASQ